jgi:hypothetical protein
VSGSGVRRTSSALIGFEQAVGIDRSLERRPEGEPCRLGRLARIVGRVESVCTDPSAKSPTGPFSLIHPGTLPVLPAAAAAFFARRRRAGAPALLGQPSALPSRRAVFASRFASCLTAPGAEIRRRSEANSTVCLGQLRWKPLCVPFCVPFAARDRGGPRQGVCVTTATRNCP